MPGPPDVPPLTGEVVGLAAWRASTSQAFVPLDIHPLGGDEFSGRLASAQRGGLSVFQLEHTAAAVARTPQLIARSRGDMLKVSLQVEGDGMVEQDGRVTLLHPGDFAIYDTARPYTLRFDRPTRMVVLAFPHDALPMPREEIAQVTATAFTAGSPLGAVVNPFLGARGDGVLRLRAADHPGPGCTARAPCTTPP